MESTLLIPADALLEAGLLLWILPPPPPPPPPPPGGFDAVEMRDASARCKKELNESVEAFGFGPPDEDMAADVDRDMVATADNKAESAP